VRLKDRVAIIAGAGTVKPGMGNGRATAMLFAREGARVVAIDKVLSSAQETVRLIKELGGEAIALEADVTSEDQAQKVVEQVIIKYGRLDILFNNVGIAYSTKAGIKVPENEWDDIMATNLKGILFMSKYAIPEMAKSGGGAIINNSSMASFMSHQIFAYTTSKAGVNALTKCLAYSAARYNVRVNCVAPGLIVTPMAGPVMGEKRDSFVEERVALKRQGKPEEVASVVLFLASDDSAYMTGQTLCVDGGMNIS
jgi:NAD(P)-dependent dehydrogenase (short-subunit alcohol dehydrogenase family)